MLKLTDSQDNELRGAMHGARKAYLRLKALAIWNLGQGRSQREVGKLLHVSPTSVFNWQKRYLLEGLPGLEVRPGRGRRPRANLEEIKETLHRTPRGVGISRTRWTLTSLAQATPSLAGFSPSGVWRALKRARLSHKRAQPRVMSPDPAYVEKRALVGSASRSAGAAPGGGFAL